MGSRALPSFCIASSSARFTRFNWSRLTRRRWFGELMHTSNILRATPVHPFAPIARTNL
jgi:hypothetical protein